jgi:hypothetical protein
MDGIGLDLAPLKKSLLAHFVGDMSAAHSSGSDPVLSADVGVKINAAEPTMDVRAASRAPCSRSCGEESGLRMTSNKQ